MNISYDTRTIHPFDQYDYYRAGAAAELASSAVHGCAPGGLLAVMSVAQIEDFEIEVFTWSADSEIVAQRTERLIRACDPECYRIYLCVRGGLRVEQAGNQVALQARDIGLFDSSRPWVSTHPVGPGRMRAVMLTFPRALVPIDRARVRPLIGTLIPRKMQGHSVMARFLIELAENVELRADPDLAHILSECTVGLFHQGLGQPDGITSRTCQLLDRARVRAMIRQHLSNPELGPNQIAHAANISPRALYQRFQGSEFTPMQLVKQLRLQECYRILQDPASAATPIKDISAAHGYTRSDQFARDFKHLFGESATQVRKRASRATCRCGREDDELPMGYLARGSADCAVHQHVAR